MGTRTIIAKFSILSGVSLLLMLFLMSGCTRFLGGSDAPTPSPMTGERSEVALTGVGKLACNKECADQAQCGSNQELGEVVLLSSTEPRLDGHDLVAGHNFNVEIRESRDVEIFRPGAENSQFMRFYKVYLKNEQEDRDAWVAGWCIEVP